ncbi:response regulator transcription factor [Kineosporia babensis]|uniref:Response regulator transcription factor n=1 Tax=Kineosporia babensis TaxID=499548 RepID=A0A9X1NKH5_9ACTN|nr:response regulator transcription factor [Kineosporia babensis]MCD5314778.1 response regulator transcription factor [Kineosporia babensis]
MTIRVLLVDDQALLRSTLAMLFRATPDLDLVGEAGTGVEAVELARSTRADVVVMDIRMPDMDGIEATRRITGDEDLAGVRILVLTTFETDELVIGALQAGASGFLGKGASPEELIQAIRTIADGESLLSPSATTALIGRFLEQPQITPTMSTRTPVALTERERQIVTLVGAGLSNQEIAERLFISPATAKTHVNRAMMKTAARDRAQLVVFAYETGLVSPARRPAP